MCLYHNFSEQIIKNAYPNKQYNHSEHASKDKVIMATGPGDGNIITISSQWLKEQMTQYISSLLQRRGQSVLAKQIVATHHVVGRAARHLCLDDAFIVFVPTSCPLDHYVVKLHSISTRTHKRLEWNEQRKWKKVTEDGTKSVYIVHKIVKKVIIEDGQAPKAIILDK